MNVLILTPDAVGSTLLQRLITIYMNNHKFDRPVINLHELTNGLVKYHSKAFNQDVLGKPEDANTGWGYYQSLEEIVGLLNSVDHYKTSRLAHYHIRNRGDTVRDQIPFYQYLNENFYIITCRRHNLFEHALSWAMSKITKKLNVYEGEEKVDSFFHLYKNGIEIDPNSIIQTLENYKQYIKWCNDHFNVASYFYYEEHLPKIENYILSLPIFAQQTQRLTWNDSFGLEFNDWNRCHYLGSDIGTLALQHQDKFKELETTLLLGYETKANVNKVKEFLQNYNNVKDPSWPNITSVSEFNNLPNYIKQEVTDTFKIPVPDTTTSVDAKYSTDLAPMLPQDHRDFLNMYKEQFNVANGKINDLKENKVLIGNVPIKKQTMAEKRYMIKNFNHCLDVYNQWIEYNPDLGNKLNYDIIDSFAQKEQDQWKPQGLLTSSK